MTYEERKEILKKTAMRQMTEYISREELIKALETDFNRSWCSKPQGVEEYVEGARDEYDDVLKIICSMAAADVQPVIHSRWIDDGTHTCNAFCENCGMERGSKAWNRDDFKYCFCCGARMDGDTECQ